MEQLPFAEHVFNEVDFRKMGIEDAEVDRKVKNLILLGNRYERQLLERLGQAYEEKCGHVVCIVIAEALGLDVLQPHFTKITTDCLQCKSILTTARHIWLNEIAPIEELDEEHEKISREVIYIILAQDDYAPLRMDILEEISALRHIGILSPLRLESFLHDSKQVLENYQLGHFLDFRKVCHKYIGGFSTKRHTQLLFLLELEKMWTNKQFMRLSAAERAGYLRENKKKKIYDTMNQLKYALEHDSYDYMEPLAKNIYKQVKEYQKVS